MSYPAQLGATSVFRTVINRVAARTRPPMTSPTTYYRPGAITPRTRPPATPTYTPTLLPPPVMVPTGTPLPVLTVQPPSGGFPVLVPAPSDGGGGGGGGSAGPGTSAPVTPPGVDALPSWALPVGLVAAFWLLSR